MEFGRILRRQGTIALDEWSQIIEMSRFLKRIPDKTVINPFTSESIFVPGEGRAYYMDNAAIVGAITLESGELLTDNVPDDVCYAIASQLGAIVVVDDRS